jgi:hypothetical protein
MYEIVLRQSSPVGESELRISMSTAGHPATRAGDFLEDSDMALRWLATVIVSAALLGACGDDEKKATDAGTDAGEAGKGGNGGTGGTPAEPIQCGATECAPPVVTLPEGGIPDSPIPITPDIIASFGFGPENCCAGANKDICGVTQSSLIMDGSCLERDQPGRPAPADECPAGSATIMTFELPLMGCCRPDNKCGVDLGLLGVGCLETTEAARIQGMGGGAAGMFDASLPVIEPKDCVYAPSSDDAGTEDAGR